MAEEFRTVVNILEQFGKDTVDSLQKSIDAKSISASGNMRQSLNYNVVTSPDITRFTLNFGKATYATQMDKGRPPTKRGGNGAVYRSITGMQGWISQKGIAPPMTVTYKKKTKQGIKVVSKTFKDIKEANRSLAYLIARKIHRVGYKATHFYSEVVTPQLFTELKSNIQMAYKKDLLIEIKKGI